MKQYISQAPEKISDFAKEFNFEMLRPYYDSETEEVMKRIAIDSTYHKAMSFLWPGISHEEAVQKALSTKSPYEFQTGYMPVSYTHLDVYKRQI